MEEGLASSSKSFSVGAVGRDRSGGGRHRLKYVPSSAYCSGI